MIAKALYTAGIAMGTAALTVGGLSMIGPDRAPARTISVNHGEVMAAGSGGSGGVAGSVTTVERAVLFPGEILRDVAYEDLTIGILNDTDNSFISGIEVNGHTVSEDGIITRLTINTSQISGDRMEYSFEILVDGKPVTGPLIINQCVHGESVVLDVPPVPVGAGQDLTIRFSDSPTVCEDTPDFNEQILGPYIIDIERERVVTPGLPGDVNGDGMVDFNDLVATLFLFTDGDGVTT